MEAVIDRRRRWHHFSLSLRNVERCKKLLCKRSSVARARQPQALCTELIVSLHTNISFGRVISIQLKASFPRVSEVHLCVCVNAFFFSHFSQTGRREDVHAPPPRAHQHSAQGDQVVRLPLAHTKVVGRGKVYQLSSR
jgi:hypothetical protein